MASSLSLPAVCNVMAQLMDVCNFANYCDKRNGILANVITTIWTCKSQTETHLALVVKPLEVMAYLSDPKVKGSMDARCQLQRWRHERHKANHGRKFLNGVLDDMQSTLYDQRVKLKARVKREENIQDFNDQCCPLAPWIIVTVWWTEPQPQRAAVDHLSMHLQINQTNPTDFRWSSLSPEPCFIRDWGKI